MLPGHGIEMSLAAPFLYKYFANFKFPYKHAMNIGEKKHGDSFLIGWVDGLKQTLPPRRIPALRSFMLPEIHALTILIEAACFGSK